jgi:uncharacterized membrane protein YdbT with pleckstrin-like domain
MSYLDENLMAGEQVVYRTRLHWVVFAAAVLVLAIAVLAGLLGLPAGIVLSLMLLAGMVGLVNWITYSNSEFGVTNKRVLIKVGWISRRSLELVLAKVEGIQVDQDIAARLWGYGTITITGTGGTKERFTQMGKPFEFRKKVQEQIAVVQERPTLAGGPSVETRAERDCPYCAERILAKARVCKHCGREVIPVG